MHFPPRRILAALDGGEASHRATALAALIAGRTGAALDVLHATAFDAPAYFTSDQISRLEAEHELARAAARDRIAADLESRGVVPDGIVIVDSAVADEAILEQASRYDLVCMGTHGRRGARRWWLGSVAERVALGAPVPVLVVRGDNATDPSVFARVTVAGAEGARLGQVMTYATALAGAFEGVVEPSPSLEACPADVLAGSSLVVVARGSGAGGMSTVTTTSLRECGRPLLIVPVAAGAQKDSQ